MSAPGTGDIHPNHLACIEFVELVTEYLDDSMDGRLRALIEDHLRLCEGCRNYLDEIRRTVATIARIGRMTEPFEPSAPVQAVLLATFRAWRGTVPSSRPADG